MKAFIHTVSGRPFNEECEVAQQGFEKLGVECVPFSSNEVLEAANREDIVVGGMYVTGHALAIRGVVPPEIDYPNGLRPYLGRRLWECTVGELSASDLPLFIKSRHEKELPGIVARTLEDLADYLSLGPDYPVWCSEPVEFVSEWRFFVRYGRLSGQACYRGDPETWPDLDVINSSIKGYADAPAAYGLDLGVASDGRTLLVEVNDGYALGCYGIDSVAYALFLAARWAELVGVDDQFAGLSCYGKPKRAWPDMNFNQGELNCLLHSVETATDAFCNVVFMVAWYNAVGAELVHYLKEGKRTRTDVWLWLASRLHLELYGIGGRRFMFPRVQTVRYVVDPDAASTLGSSSIQHYDTCSVALSGWIDIADAELREQLYDLLHNYAEKDAVSYGYKHVFTLIADDDYLGEGFYLARGYHSVPDKDEEDLARALGAHVIHDHVVEKDF